MEVIAIVSALLGPIFGAMFAWIFSKREARVSALVNLVVKTLEDAQNYKHRAIRLYRMAIKTHRDWALERDDALMEMKLLESRLNADAMALHLLVGDTGSKGVKDVAAKLIGLSDTVFDDETLRPANDRLDQVINDFNALLDRLFAELSKLKSWSPFDDL